MIDKRINAHWSNDSRDSCYLEGETEAEKVTFVAKDVVGNCTLKIRIPFNVTGVYSTYKKAGKIVMVDDWDNK